MFIPFQLQLQRGQTEEMKIKHRECREAEAQLRMIEERLGMTPTQYDMPASPATMLHTELNTPPSRTAASRRAVRGTGATAVVATPTTTAPVVNGTASRTNSASGTPASRTRRGTGTSPLNSKRPRRTWLRYSSCFEAALTLERMFLISSIEDPVRIYSVFTAYVASYADAPFGSSHNPRHAIFGGKFAWRAIRSTAYEALGVLCCVSSASYRQTRSLSFAWSESGHKHSSLQTQMAPCSSCAHTPKAYYRYSKVPLIDSLWYRPLLLIRPRIGEKP